MSDRIKEQREFSETEPIVSEETGTTKVEIQTHLNQIQEPLILNTYLLEGMKQHIPEGGYYTVKLKYAVDESEGNLLSGVEYFSDVKRTDDTLDFSELIIGHGVDFESIQGISCIGGQGEPLDRPLEVKGGTISFYTEEGDEESSIDIKTAPGEYTFSSEEYNTQDIKLKRDEVEVCKMEYNKHRLERWLGMSIDEAEKALSKIMETLEKYGYNEEEHDQTVTSSFKQFSDEEKREVIKLLPNIRNGYSLNTETLPINALIRRLITTTHKHMSEYRKDPLNYETPVYQ